MPPSSTPEYIDVDAIDIEAIDVDAIQDVDPSHLDAIRVSFQTNFVDDAENGLDLFVAQFIANCSAVRGGGRAVLSLSTSTNMHPKLTLFVILPPTRLSSTPRSLGASINPTALSSYQPLMQVFKHYGIESLLTLHLSEVNLFINPSTPLVTS